MQTVWNRTPNRFQSDVIPIILQMMTGDKSPRPLLLVQPTGSGKSAVPQTAAVVTSGITFIIECTQSLGADQASKILQSRTTPGLTVHAHQLDVIKTTADRMTISDQIRNVLSAKKVASVDTGIVCYIVFTSPEELNRPIWLKLFEDMMEIEMVTLFCIDEVHLFVEYGLSF